MDSFRSSHFFFFFNYNLQKKQGKLVDKFRPGDEIEIDGILMQRYKKLVNNERPDINLFILANDIIVLNSEKIA